ncbi:MAG: Dipeptidyl-peptidase 7 [Phycisphaerae bacterium]|nr:Dipeptidyl-peptidase 7 [Phycisphaerae bacterium]
MKRSGWIMILAAVGFGLLVSASWADEGMWLLNHLPTKQLEKNYQFTPDPAWVEHVQKSCLRISSGGSGSFVSPNGLVMTNHHVAAEALAALSTAERDLLKNGFYAATREQELKCPGLSVMQLISIEDVTDQVNTGVKAEMSPAEQQEAQNAAITRLTAAAKEKTGLTPEMVKLYHGAKFHLYLYQGYDDVRLVMAPEKQIAFFGGDLDNFNYPRYNLDISFLRVYQNGQPLNSENYFKWSANGAADGELIFMAGHPFRTRRLYSMSHLEFMRDVDLPLVLDMYNQLEVELGQFIQRGADEARIGEEPLFGIQNGRKAFGGILQGLLSERIMQTKLEAENKLRKMVASHAEALKLTDSLSGWKDLDQALIDVRSYYDAYYLLENWRSRWGELYSRAKLLARITQQRTLPDDQRLAEFQEAVIKSQIDRMLSDEPVHPEREEIMLADALTRLARRLGGTHPVVVAALGGRSPTEQAARVIHGTKLQDRAVLQQLLDGGQSSVLASDDPLVRLAAVLEPLGRQLLDRYEKEYLSVETSAYAKIAKMRFKMLGENNYPDATYTLRLSYGTVQGYEENGRKLAYTTTIGETYSHAERHQQRWPFILPESWMQHKSDLDPAVPFNFVSTCDIIGGNSGSPVFNRTGEIVGVVFDGNIQSLIWDVQFDQQQGRSVSVHSAAIIEALRKVYNAQPLVEELIGKSK